MVLVIRSLCIVCCDEVPRMSKTCNSSRKHTVRDLLKLVGISFASFRATWSYPDDDDPVDLSFCGVCEALITRGFELKKKLRKVKSDLIRNSVRSSWEFEGQPNEEILVSLDETERYRFGVWKLLKQCFSDCEIRIPVADGNSELSPSLRKVRSEGSRINVKIEVEQQGSPASCDSIGTISFCGGDDDPLDYDLPCISKVDEKGDDGKQVGETRTLRREIQENSTLLSENYSIPLEGESQVLDVGEKSPSNKLRRGLTGKRQSDEEKSKPQSHRSRNAKSRQNTSRKKDMEDNEYDLREDSLQEPDVHSPKPKRRRCTLNVKYKAEPIIEVIDPDPDDDDDNSWTAENELQSVEDEDCDQELETESPAINMVGSKRKKSSLMPTNRELSENIELNSGDQRAEDNLEGFKCEQCSMTCFSSEILAIHVKEMHEKLDDKQLAFKCPTCEMEMSAETYLSKSKFLESQRYTWEVTSVQRLIYVNYFYELCEFHFVKCLRSSLNFNVIEEQSNREKEPSKVEPDAKSVVNVDGDFYFYDTCILCSITLAPAVLKCHYSRKHGLTYCSDYRFACDHCKEIYLPRHQETHIGKLIPSEMEHFKGFLSAHKNCNLKSQEKKFFACHDCKIDFPTPEKFLAHNTNKHHTFDKYVCDKCSFRTSNIIFMRRHAQNAHSLPLQIHCARCLKSFRCIADYTEHHAKHFKTILPSPASTLNPMTFGNSQISSKSSSSSKPKPRRKHYCKICGVISSQLPRHMRRMHGYLEGVTVAPESEAPRNTPVVRKISKAAVSECFVCDKTFINSGLLDIHLQEDHDSPEGRRLKFQCVGCKLTFDQADYASSDPDGTFKYPPCNVSGTTIEFSTFAEFCENHYKTCFAARRGRIRRKPASLILPGDEYKCRRCDETFNSDLSLQSHLKGHYAHLLKKCVLCPYLAKELSQVRFHLMARHSLNVLHGDRYYCLRCHAFYDSGRPELYTGQFMPEDQDNFNDFAAKHDGCSSERLTFIPCGICSKGFKFPNQIVKHQLRAHPKHQTKCAVCDVQFTSEEVYNNHRIECKILAVRIYKCEVCPYKTSREYILKVHMQGHADKREFICDVCGKGFNAEPQLKKHKAIHEERGNVLCPLCGKLFQRKHNLYNHIYSFHQRRRPAKKSKSLQTQGEALPEARFPECSKTDSDHDS